MSRFFVGQQVEVFTDQGYLDGGFIVRIDGKASRRNDYPIGPGGFSTENYVTVELFNESAIPYLVFEDYVKAVSTEALPLDSQLYDDAIAATEIMESLK